jgi:hypothetical protein
VVGKEEGEKESEPWVCEVHARFEDACSIYYMIPKTDNDKTGEWVRDEIIHERTGKTTYNPQRIQYKDILCKVEWEQRRSILARGGKSFVYIMGEQGWNKVLAEKARYKYRKK